MLQRQAAADLLVGLQFEVICMHIENKFIPKTLLSLIAVFGLTISWAGRPVFQVLDLEDLVGRSQIIAVVQKEKPFKAISRKVDGECEEQRWPLIIKEILHNRKHHPFEADQGKGSYVAGSRIKVLVNRVALTDCQYRIDNPSGYSFSAERYETSDPRLIENSNVFIIFLIVINGSVELTTEKAYEPIKLKNSILAVLNRVRPPATQPGAPADRATDRPGG